MVPVIEAVPNFSEGRDPEKIRALVDVIAGAGVDVLDWSADPDHHRSVVTFVGDPAAVESAALAGARFAVEHIDLRAHQGVHPRVGALDVLPFVPLRDVTMEDAVRMAWRVAERLTEVGLPSYLYGKASRPPGRGLAELRRGGFEALAGGFPADRRPDFAPPASDRPHPSAGITCVGAREVLLAWNVFVEGITVEEARSVAAAIRERGGGFAGLRALGLHLPRQGRTQISMNLEDPSRTPPMDVFRAIEAKVGALGGRVVETEVIGMIPDALVLPAAEDRLKVCDLGSSRLLSHGLAAHTIHRLEDWSARSDVLGDETRAANETPNHAS
ncbi:MAG: glutamate formimidoyltransferase [Gemmatimonadota bacterium]|nr:glutamate formimidoyltransferase [Gemmatimonadota bacterium]MDH5759784.1 glutamate formimidoyltransferase [Gemmatimonadota bacterium]